MMWLLYWDLLHNKKQNIGMILKCRKKNSVKESSISSAEYAWSMGIYATEDKAACIRMTSEAFMTGLMIEVSETNISLMLFAVFSPCFSISQKCTLMRKHTDLWSGPLSPHGKSPRCDPSVHLAAGLTLVGYLQLCLFWHDGNQCVDWSEELIPLM